MEQHGDFPKPMVIGGLRMKVLVPFGTAAQKGCWPNGLLSALCDKPSSFDQRFGDRCCLNIERPQHARRVAPEPMIALGDMGQGIGSHCTGQLHRRGDKSFQITPTAGGRNRALKGCAIAMRFQESGPQA